MLKKIAIALGVVLLLIGSVVGYALYNANALAARFKPELEKLATKSLESPVHISSLDASILPTTKLVVHGFTVGEEGEALTLDNLTLKVALSALLTGSLHITELALESPELTFEKGPDGVTVQGLPKRKTPASEAGGRQESPPPHTGAPSSPAAELPAGLKIDLERFAIHDATIHFNDPGAKQHYIVQDLEVTTGVKLTGGTILLPGLAVSGNALGIAPFSLKSESIEVEPAPMRIAIEKITAEILKNTLSVTGDLALGQHTGNVKVSSPGIELQRLRPLITAFAPDVERMNPHGTIALDLTATLSQPDQYLSKGTVTVKDIGADVGGFSLGDLGGTLLLAVNAERKSISSDNLALKVNGTPLSVALDASLAEEQATVKRVEVRGFGGSLTSTARYALPSGAFSTEGEVKEMKLEEIMTMVKPGAPAVLTGSLRALSFKVAGTAKDQVKESVKGSISLDVRDGALKGVNLPARVLDAVQGLPMVSGTLLSKVPPSARSAMENPDTEIKSLTGNFALGGGSLSTPDLRLESTLFTLTADGTVGFEGALNLRSSIVFSKEFSTQLAESHKEVARIYDREGRLVIPLTIQGVAPKLVVLPDVQKLIQLAGKQAIEKEGKKLLDKALGEKGKGLGGLLGF